MRWRQEVVARWQAQQASRDVRMQQGSNAGSSRGRTDKGVTTTEGQRAKEMLEI